MIKNLGETRASYDNLISAIASWYNEFKIMLKSYFETHDCDGIDIMDGNIKWMVISNGWMTTVKYIH